LLVAERPVYRVSGVMELQVDRGGVSFIGRSIDFTELNKGVV